MHTEKKQLFGERGNYISLRPTVHVLIMYLLVEGTRHVSLM